MLLNFRGRLTDVSRPLIMGILNVTPDSFFDGGKFNDENHIRNQIDKMVSEGADIIDVGAVSSRPGASDVSIETEWQRLEPAIKILSEYYRHLVFSVDTSSSVIAEKALLMGASMINDITAGSRDARMMDLLSGTSIPFIMMHMQGMPSTMQKNPEYKNVTMEIIAFFTERLEKARNKKIKDIIIDPGFGFGKTTEHNFMLLNDFDQLKVLGCPLMAGLSRKSMVSKVLKLKTAETLNGTTVLNTIALLKGASILRVHDVKEAREALLLTEKLKTVSVVDELSNRQQ